MKNLKKLLVLSVGALVLASCAGGNTSSSGGNTSSSSQPGGDSGSGSGSSQQPAPAVYEREDEDVVLERTLGTFDELYAAALAETDKNVRYAKYAKAEAELLATGLFVPTTTQGGTYGMSRIAPHTVPYASWGFDSDRLMGMVIVDKDGSNEKNFITVEDRQALKDAWEEAYLDPEHHNYDPAGYLTGRGYTLVDEYNTVYSANPLTLDPGVSYYASDAEVFINCYDGLVQYDNLGRLQPAIASSWDVSADGKTYTFHLRNDVQWFNAQGVAQRAVKAQDFVDGFEHVLDGDASVETGLAGLVNNIVGAQTYYAESKDAAWFAANVGFKALDDQTLEIKLVKAEDFFMSRLTYNPFLPLNREKFIAEGGAFGVDAFAEKYELEAYNYGNISDVESIYYTSAFIPEKIDSAAPGGQMILNKNDDYYRASEVTLDSIKWTYNDGSDPTALYNSVLAGTYTATSLSQSAGTIATAKDSGDFDKYAYVSDTNATTYFNAVNLNRGTFSYKDLVSDQSEEQKIANHKAMNNIHFRRALQYAFDRRTFNAIDVGSDAALFSIRNIYTQPTLIVLMEQTTVGDKVFEPGTTYGDMVEYYLKADHDLDIECDDGVDGWYNPEKAREELALAKAELGADWKNVVIDVATRTNHVRVTAQYNAFKQNIESVFNDGSVTVKPLGTTVAMDYYMCTYYASTGEQVNYDAFYGSGWGPDFQDPSSYLGTFSITGDASMIKVIGC